MDRTGDEQIRNFFADRKTIAANFEIRKMKKKKKITLLSVDDNGLSVAFARAEVSWRRRCRVRVPVARARPERNVYEWRLSATVTLFVLQPGAGLLRARPARTGLTAPSSASGVYTRRPKKR